MGQSCPRPDGGECVVFGYVLDLLPGLGLTVALWLAITAIGFPLGLLLGYALALSPRAIRIPVSIVVNIARGFPALVLLYLVYAGLPAVGITLSSVASIIVAFSFTTAGYTAGIFRTAIESVPRAHREAAAALGISFLRTQRLIVLPQALRAAAAPLVGFSVIVLQATSLGFAIGLRELTGLAYNLGTIGFEALPYMIASGIFYLVLCLLLARVAAMIRRPRIRKLPRLAADR